MKKKLIIFLLLFCSKRIDCCQGLVRNLFGCDIEQVNQNEDFKKFVEKFAPPTQVLQALGGKSYDNYNQFSVIKCSNGGIDFDLTCKGTDLNRVLNAYIMDLAITRNHLTSITVPKKYIIKINNQYLVFAQHIKGIKPTTLSEKEHKDIFTLFEKTHFIDMKAENFIIDEVTNKLTIIDTENRSFGKATASDRCFYRPELDYQSDHITELEEFFGLINKEFYNAYREQKAEDSSRGNFIPLNINQELNEAAARNIGIKDVMALRNFLGPTGRCLKEKKDKVVERKTIVYRYLFFSVALLSCLMLKKYANCLENSLYAGILTK